ncbi:hypothetical protein OKA05_14605 [Luteolibacter arcticus]|uniref:Uncharacterized protein n=1 Tax=Luteolibacter arcticus TaxID=1581411 RepID=A0ABT3GJY4_9BACT|nr:hypothetical protein [Luteolibacter arcticus]MCW1923795.1 hypothetical protein [Luteolibacter arcticus]
MSLPGGEAIGFGPQAIVAPANAQYYEVFPNVVRSDGSESYRIRVNLGRSARRVYFPYLTSNDPLFRTDFSDDGQNGDAVAGDRIYTSSPFVPVQLSPSFNYRSQPPGESLPGLTFVTCSTIHIVETDGSETSILTSPEVGVISSAGLTPLKTAGSDFQIASHLLNVRSSKPTFQNQLRGIGANNVAEMQATVKKVIGQVGDNYDFILLLSSMHAERTPAISTSANYFAGMHIHAQSSSAGTGMPQINQPATYGSAGRLLGMSQIDTATRGIFMNNVLHELTHQWAAGISDASFGKLKRDPGHWHGFSNINSLVGGFEWVPRSDGPGWLVNTDSSGSQIVREMPAVERYFAGFCPPSEVGPLMAYDSTTTFPWDRGPAKIPILPEEIVANFSVEDLIAVHGKPVADVLEGQKHFNILFVVESVERFLTPREMTFYNKLAEEFERLLRPSEPSPRMMDNWVPATRFFGRGVTLSTRVSGWDQDLDGLYDDWETTYFGNLAQSSGGDPDRDGADNFSEMAYLSHPAHADLRRGVRAYETATHQCLETTRFLPTLDYRMEIYSGDPPQGWVRNNTGNWLGPHFRRKIPKADIASGAAGRRMICRGKVTAAAP